MRYLSPAPNGRFTFSRSGHGPFLPYSGLTSYQAAKFATDGFSRVLQAETAPFGVKVIVVEPSGFKTDWAGSSMIIRDIPEAYAETIGIPSQDHCPPGIIEVL